ncbi:hypothetical protein CLOM_g215 [Closterium sp. NIES-68]|nr:hypothetical protein CLOM_g215 [Closterium sp. NIES-68]GJP68026.1 hypothetical protein CLOP_g24783 [Closterium sp. NIES-67]
MKSTQRAISRSILSIVLLAVVLLACAHRSDAKAKPPPKLGPGRRELNGITKRIQGARKFNVFLIHFKKTNLDPFIARYADRQPLTFLMPRDEAFSALPSTIRSQLSGKKLVQLMQYHMIMEKWGIDFLSSANQQKVVRAFRTVLGMYIYFLPNPGMKLVKVNSVRFENANMGFIISGDIGGKNTYPRFITHGINKVIIPPGVFK